MNLNDIIKTDKDRLFQVDDECYLLFTGDSLEDEHPFIRIGNWIDMPAESIPLIRNIVITDSLTGNPACEQFNIDTKNLEYNRYIGSAEVIRPYMEFQKLLGIDLSKVEIVDIKKDLPEFSMGKNMSDEDQFIGVFYRDGSFKTLHRGSTLLELKDKGTEDFFQDSSESGPRIALLDGALTFAGQSSAISYDLPYGGINRFIELGINYGPDAVIHPADNYINLLSFLKEKKSGKTHIFTQKNDNIRVIKKLFNNQSLNISDIAGFRYGSSSDLLVENYTGSVNISAAFGQGPRVAFVKSAAGIRQVLKDKLDGIIIPYSAYKESVLLFKSTSTPIAIINDTNENIRSRLAMNTIPLRDNSLYRLLKTNPEELNKRYGDLDEPLERLKAIKSGIKAEHKELFNIMSLIRLTINSSTDRALCRELQKLYHEFQPSLKPYDLFEPEERPAFTLAFCEGGIYQFADTVAGGEMTGGKKHGDEKNIKIAEDRKRLERLLALYLNKGSLSKEKTRHALEALRGSLKQRKKTYTADISREPYIADIANALSLIKDTNITDAANLANDTDTTNTASLINNTSMTDSENPASAATDTNGRGDTGAFYEKSTAPKQETTQRKAADILNTKHPKSGRDIENPAASPITPGRKKAALVIAPLAILAIFLLIWKGQKTSDDYLISETLKSQSEKKSPASTDDKSAGKTNVTSSDAIFDEQKKASYESVPARFKSNITPADIYRYANKVAVKNGYRKLSEYEMKHKDPNRIFPQETLSMLDDQIITVASRDTLWNISERKLMEIDLTFYETVKQIESASKGERKKLIELARSLAFSKHHKEILDSL